MADTTRIIYRKIGETRENLESDGEADIGERAMHDNRRRFAFLISKFRTNLSFACQILETCIRISGTRYKVFILSY